MVADTNRLVQPVAQTYTTITHGSYSAAASAGQFPPRLAQPVNFLNDCIVNATIGGQRCPTQIGWCSRLLKPTLFRGCFSRSIPPAAGSASQFPQRLHSKCYNRRASVADTSRQVQPVAQTYITNSRQVDWLGGWIGGYMLCGWRSLSTSCMHGILVRPFFLHVVAVQQLNAKPVSAGTNPLLASPHQTW